jgi:tetratricopeptide (TPR) repeat protein
MSWDSLINFDGAMADFNKAIELNPTIAVYYLNRGITLKKSKRFDDALADFNKAIEINPNYYLAYLQRGDVKIRLDQLNDIFQDFNMAIQLKPDDGRGYFGRGMYYLKFGDKELAKRDFLEAKKFGIENMDDLLNEIKDIIPPFGYNG